MLLYSMFISNIARNTERINAFVGVPHHSSMDIDGAFISSRDKHCPNTIDKWKFFLIVHRAEDLPS